MDLLKKELGYLLIETLIGIILLGMIVTFSLVIFNKIFSNPNNLLRSEALYLAQSEVDNCIKLKSTRDTVYSNAGGSLIINRSIASNDSLITASISVQISKLNKNLVLLSVNYAR